MRSGKQPRQRRRAGGSTPRWKSELNGEERECRRQRVSSKGTSKAFPYEGDQQTIGSEGTGQDFEQSHFLGRMTQKELCDAKGQLVGPRPDADRESKRAANGQTRSFNVPGREIPADGTPPPFPARKRSVRPEARPASTRQVYGGNRREICSTQKTSPARVATERPSTTCSTGSRFRPGTARPLAPTFTPSAFNRSSKEEGRGCGVKVNTRRGIPAAGEMPITSTRRELSLGLYSSLKNSSKQTRANYPREAFPHSSRSVCSLRLLDVGDNALVRGLHIHIQHRD